MDSTSDSAPRTTRKDLPLDEALAPLREIVESLSEAQRQGAQALSAVLERIEAVSAESTRAAETQAHPEASASDPSPEPHKPAAAPGQRIVAIELDREPPEPAAPAPSSVRAPGDSDDRAFMGDREEPAPWHSPRQVAVADDRKLVESEPVKSPPSPAPVAPARPVTPAADEDARNANRRLLAEIQRIANEVDRISSAEALEEYLWKFAKDRELRCMRMQEKGRALYAEDCCGFANFDEDHRARLRRVVVPFEADGLFGAVAQDRAVYSGPRPAKGLPVDLILVMGKQAPAWCVIVPMPYRNRWGTFLYFDAPGEKLEAILEVEIVARMIVLQLRAARYRPHQPAERVRAFRAQTLRDRKRKRDLRVNKVESTHESKSEDSEADPLTHKRGKVSPSALSTPPEPSRFDKDGNLVRPLDGTEILARLGELPPMPRIAVKLIGMLKDPDTEIGALQEIIATDQAISVRLLQIANSSLYGNMREASTIAEAVVRLGFTAIRSWLLATVTRRLFVGDGDSVHVHRLWQQSVIAALGAELIAVRSGVLDPEIAFVGGLMQNIGLLLVARNHGDVFEHIDEQARADGLSYFEVERRLLGFDHADVSGLLLQRWGLGDTLVAAVSSHHRLQRAGAEQVFAAIIALAEEFALRIGQGPTEASDDDLTETEMAEVLGLDSEAIEEIADELAQRVLDRSLFSG